MTKQDLIDAVSERAEITKKDTKLVIDAALEIIMESVASGESVTIPGFGAFERRFRQGRTAVRPGTTEKIDVPASHYPAFKAGKPFKEAVK